MHRCGFTLLELLIVLAIAISLGYLAYPPFSQLLERIQSTSRINGLAGLVRFARQTAITRHQWVTLCPALGESCTRSQDWSTGILCFADDNRDGARQPDEPILAYQNPLEPGERLTWRSFRQRYYLQFRAEGYTNWQNGSFAYCPASGDARNGKVLIINIQGRPATAADLDGDGIVEQASGEPLAC